MNPPSKFQRHINQQRKFAGGSWSNIEDTKEWCGEYWSEKRADGTGWDSGYKNSDAYDELSDPTHRFVWAGYDTGSYEGSAAACWVDWEGKCWYASCSHCSCNGLDIWVPEESNEAYLRNMLGDQSIADVFEQVMKEVKYEKDILHSTV